ncbi:MAG: PqqD family peptide modification chaperone [Actinomycetota bacterium]
MAQEVEIAESQEIEADEIGLDFVPQPRDSVMAVEFDGELLLVDRDTGRLNLLDPIGSIVWSCFDGAGDLDDLAQALAKEFGAPVETVRSDVLEMTRNVGGAGLLVGVSPHRLENPSQPAGLEVGEEMTPFTLPDLDGSNVDLAGLRGQEVLLVNWSPACGYCARIAPELAEVQAAFADQGGALVLLTAGEADANRELLETHGLAATALLKQDADEEFEDPFPSMGTPVAYLLDAEGRVAAPLAFGSGEVPQLARRAAGMLEPDLEPETARGHDHDDHDHADDAAPAPADGPKYLPAGGGVCNPGTSSSKKPREWAATSAYAVGEYHIGVRADSVATDELIGRIFAAHRLPAGTEAPENYSIVLSERSKGGARGLNLLLRGNTTIVRSRSARRVLLALASQMSSVLEPEEGLLRSANVGALVGDAAVLLPSVVLQWLEEMQPRLTRLGVRLVDEPYASIDPELLELVVPEPRVQLDELALAAVEEPKPSRSELPRVKPGRYPLRAWTLWESAEPEAELTRARAVAASLSSVFIGPDAFDSVLPQLGRVLERVSPVRLVFGTAEELADSLKDRLAGVR